MILLFTLFIAVVVIKHKVQISGLLIIIIAVIIFNLYNYIYIWRYGLPWHKVLNAIVAELSIRELKIQRRRDSKTSFASKRSSDRSLFNKNIPSYIQIRRVVN